MTIVLDNFTTNNDCHIQVCYMDTSTKRMNNYEMIIKRSMKVEDVKRELHQRING